MTSCNTCVEDPSQGILVRREAGKESRTVTIVRSDHSYMISAGGEKITINQLITPSGGLNHMYTRIKSINQSKFK